MTIDRQTSIDLILDHYENPRHRGVLEHPMLDSTGVNPGCGDVVRITATADAEGRITEIAFDGEGCTISQASASLFTDMALGRPLEEILALEPTVMAEVLGEELVTQRTACVSLALNTLRDAVEHQQPDVWLHETSRRS